jgi:hypothetical protein
MTGYSVFALGARTARRAVVYCLLCAFALLLASVANAQTTSVSGAQARGAEQFLAAVASGSPQSVALAFHPTELEGLRTRLLARLRADESQSNATARARLFGAGMPLAELERMTGASFYAELAKRIDLRARQFSDVKWLATVRDGDLVHVVGRGKPPKERGTVQVVTLVTLMPYGNEWRAVVPSEVQAQIDDLLEGRARAPQATVARGASTSTPVSVDPAISMLLASAEQALIAGNCADYYGKYLSPNFRRATSATAMKTLIASCTRSESEREQLVAALRIVKTLTPRLEFDGARAVYDVSNQGLRFSSFVLERIDKSWYIAE